MQYVFIVNPSVSIDYLYKRLTELNYAIVCIQTTDLEIEFLNSKTAISYAKTIHLSNNFKSDIQTLKSIEKR